MSAEEDNRKIENTIKYYARMDGMKENSIEIAKKMN